MELDLSIRELLVKHPEYIDFLNLSGLPSEANHPMADKITLRMALHAKKLNETLFMTELASFLSDSKNQLVDSSETRDYKLYGRIPCVVQLPFQTQLQDEMLKSKLDLPCNIALARFGKEWVEESTAENPPPVFIGVGVEGMVNSSVLMGGGYGFDEPYEMNPDFKGFNDPMNIFRFISAIPLVMVVDTGRLEGRKKPTSLEALLSAEFEQSVLYPDDGDMLNGIMMTYFKKYFGDEGLHAFQRSCVGGAHPSQMIKVGGLEKNPPVMLMPYVFAEIKAKEENMELVWPSEGAPILPILITLHKEATQEERRLAEICLSKDMGEVFMRQGLFPSSHPDVCNHLPGPLLWIGWKYLYEADIFTDIQICKSVLGVS